MEVYHLIDGRYQRVAVNERGHYPIAPLGVELGIWQGCYLNVDLPWLRWWDEQGNLLLSGTERAEIALQQAEQERARADQEQARADRLAARLRELGIDPEA